MHSDRDKSGKDILLQSNTFDAPKIKLTNNMEDNETGAIKTLKSEKPPTHTRQQSLLEKWDRQFKSPLLIARNLIGKGIHTNSTNSGTAAGSR